MRARTKHGPEEKAEPTPKRPAFHIAGEIVEAGTRAFGGELASCGLPRAMAVPAVEDALDPDGAGRFQNGKAALRSGHRLRA